jgi:hypothetical protein
MASGLCFKSDLPEALAPSPQAAYEQAQAPDARVAFAADHQMTVDGNAQRLGRSSGTFQSTASGSRHL